MKASLHRLWQSRTPSERAALVVLAVILGAALYLWLVQSASHARSQLKTSIPALRAQTARLEQQAAEYERVRNTPAMTASPSDLRALVQAQAEAADLSRALIRIDAANTSQVQVVFGDVAFANWLAWIGSLQSQHVRLDACRIETSSQSGLVNITATLVRPLSP